MSIALVTGGSRRIGRHLSLAAARAGLDVAIHCRSASADSISLCAEIAALGRKAVVIEADLTSASPADLVNQASELGPVTLLVNNASLFEDDRAGSLSVDLWEQHQTINLRLPVLLAQAMAASLPAGLDGLVVNLIDQRVLRPNPQFFSYSLSKAGLWWATRTLAQALAPRIRVNAIGPGPSLASIHQSGDVFAQEVAGTLLQRPSLPEDIARALTYLIEARSVTGQMIAVDSGQHLGWQTPDIIAP